MPELPEVETIVRELAPHVVGHSIQTVRVYRPDVLRNVSGAGLARRLRGATIGALFRRAKHAVFDLDHTFLVIQPGMSGALLIHGARLTADERRYAVLALVLDDGRTIVYRDVRRLGRIYLFDQAGWDSYERRLGPEPLHADFSGDVLLRRIARSRQAIKKLLMDQTVVAGVGNIYANEALFQAGIDPSRQGLTLSRNETKALAGEVQRVLRAAIASKGTTLRDYRTGTGGRGGFQFKLHVYGRGGEPCDNCGTRLSETHLIDARTTVFCHRCQS